MDYTLIRTSRKTLAIYIRPGGVVEVRAPLRCSKREINRFVTSKETWIEEKRKLVLARTEQRFTPELEAQCRKLAQEILPGKVAHYAGLMGVAPAQVKISGAQKRWGSCSSKGSLNFSWRLMLAGDDAVDYVVVHELAHLLEMNHSPRFWAIVARALPDYKIRQKKLKEIQCGLREGNDDA